MPAEGTTALAHTHTRTRVHTNTHTRHEHMQVLSCIDCGKDFYGDEYKMHDSCISEAEKYQGENLSAVGDALSLAHLFSLFSICMCFVSLVGSLSERIAQRDHVINQLIKSHACSFHSFTLRRLVQAQGQG